MTQLEWVKRIIYLKEKYPELDIVFFVDNSEITCDYSYTAHQIREVDITYFYQENEVILTDLDELMDYFIEGLELSENAAKEKLFKEVKRVIAIKTEALNI